MLTNVLITLFVSGIIYSVQSAVAPSPEEDPSVTYVELFRHGVTAYRAEQWISCINYFARAIDDYKFYKKATSACRRKCHNEAQNNTIVTDLEDTDNRFFETGVKHTLCLIKCRKANLLGRVTVYAPEVDEAMESLIPYDYLQLCYFKHGTPDRAATAAFTFLQANPGHETMQNNLKFYLSKDSSAAQTDLKNSETKEYQELYKEGVLAYEKKNYQAVKDKMELGLEAYLEDEEICRAMCEGSFDQDGMQPDLQIALANHMTFALKSRLKCSIRLQKFDASISPEGMVARFYLYLVRAYLELDQTKEACQAVESYLLFRPKEDVSMLNARKKLKDNTEAKDEWFVPRPEALRYYRRDRTEKNLLEFIEKEFAHLVDEQNKGQKDNKLGEMQKKKS